MQSFTAPSDPHSADLNTRVLRFLHDRGVSSLRRLQVQAHDGIVTLTGTVASFYERQLCISCKNNVAGVERVIDKLSVS